MRFAGPRRAFDRYEARIRMLDRRKYLSLLLNKRQRDTYLRLIQELPLVSIASDEHLDEAVRQ